MLGFARVEREGDLAGEFKFNKKLKKIVLSVSLSFFHLNQSDNQITSTHGTQASRNSKITAHRRSISKEKRARGVVPRKNFNLFLSISNRRRRKKRKGERFEKKTKSYARYVYICANLPRHQLRSFDSRRYHHHHRTRRP